jgi:hypothetical protein
VIYLITKVGTNYTLEKLDLDRQPDEGISYQAKLDRKIYIDGVNTTIEDLYLDMPEDIDNLVLIQGEDCPNPGLRAFIEDYDAENNVITLKKDMEGGTLIAGVRYLSRYQPTMPFAKDADGIKIGTGKLRVSKFLISMREAGDFFARIFSKFRDDVIIRFSGYRVGNPATVVGEPPISSRTEKVPFRDTTDNGEIEIYTDSHLEMNFQIIEWVGQYTKKGKRIATRGGEE